MNKKIKIPVVWQVSALHLDKKILLSGVLLRRNPFTYKSEYGKFRNLLRVSKTYFTRAYANKDISITINNKTIVTSTDKHGGFSLLVDRHENSDCELRIASNEKSLEIQQTYPVTFLNTQSSFDVISDIDDTILVSYTADFFKRINALAFIPPNKRRTVGFTQKILNEFEKHATRVFYVSKSESNLFAILTSFIAHNKLPKGNLLLTPYLKFSQLFNPKKGRDYKLKNIRFILNNTNNKRFVLIGDDSQRDMEVYTEIANEYPNRILKIYIRQTKPQIFAYQKRMLEKLKLTGLPIAYFNDETPVNPQEELKQLINKDQ